MLTNHPLKRCNHLYLPLSDPSIPTPAPTPTTHNVSIPRNNAMHSCVTAIEPDERLGATTTGPREPCRTNAQHAPKTTSPALRTHAATAYDGSELATSTIQLRAAVNERENKEGARREGSGSVHGEYTPHAPHSPIHTHRTFPFASSPPFADATPSAAHGSPLDVSAVAEQPDGPRHDSHTPLVTSTGPTATLAALAACIPVHGPPDIFFTCHIPVLAHTDSRIDPTYDIADTSVNSEPKTNARESIKRRATTIDEIDEGLLAWIREDATERGWQEGWDAGALHGSAGAYREGYEAAKYECPVPIASLPAPGFEPELPLAPPTDKPFEAHGANANSVSTLNDARPQWATSLFELDPSLFHEILDQGKRKGQKAGRIEGREEGYRDGREDGLKEGFESAEES